MIPAWNEEARLSQTLEAYLPPLRRSGVPFEVIVVCDGSTDGTFSIASGFAEQGVRVLHAETKLGKGGAVLAGFRSARFSRIGFVDADGPIRPEDLFALADSLDHYDCAIASRLAAGSVTTVRRTASRRVLSRAWSLAVRGLLLLPVRDTQCGAKFFRRSAVSAILRKVALTNWAFDVSILFHVHEAGYSIQEVPVTWTESEGSKLVIVRDVPIMLLSLIGVRVMSIPGGKRRSGSAPVSQPAPP